MNVMEVDFKNYFKPKTIILSIILASLVAFFIEFYITVVDFGMIMDLYTSRMVFIKAALGVFSKMQLLYLFIAFFIIFMILLNRELKTRFFGFIYQHRFILTFLAFLVCLICQIHGSHLSQLLPYGNHKAFVGISRVIRTDEYNVNTPFAFSQYYNDFGYFSDIVRGTVTDMFLIYGQPVLDIAVIFRPFHWGYLFLSQGYGLSFYWMGRFFALLIISFEFGMFISKNNKKLALAYSLLLLFSPIIQFWFAVNMLVEMLIFGQLIILLTNYYMKTINYRKRLLISLVMVICFGGFILSMYPAWEIPLAYVFLAIFIWVIYKNHGTFKFNKKDLGLFILFTIILISLLVYIFTKSQDVVIATLNTSYPGSRIYLGGVDISDFRLHLPNLLFFYVDEILASTILDPWQLVICSTVIITFFPLSLILFGLVQFVQKKRDVLLYLLFIVYLFFSILVVIGFPGNIAKFSLLSNTTGQRLLTIISFIDLLILIRAMSLIDLKVIKHYKLISLFVSIILGVIAFMLTVEYGHTNVFITFHVISCIIIVLAFFFIFASSFNKKYLKGFLLISILVAFLGGGLINPVESGVDYYFDQPLAHEIESIVVENPNANWIVMEGFYIDSIIPLGAHTINSVNTYPNMDLWKKLDYNGQYLEEYNRYAHIYFRFQNNQSTYFDAYQDDAMYVYLNVNDVDKLNVTYLLTKEPLEHYSTNDFKFVKIYQDNEKNMIYELKGV